MAIDLPEKIENELCTKVITPQIVVDIKGYPLLCSGPTLVLDIRRQGINTPDYYNLIDLNGSQGDINQQLQLDKGGSSSTTTYKLRLVDKDKIFTELFSFSTARQEILEADARVFFGVEGGEFPKDFVPFINGTVGNIDMGAGFVEIAVNHPDKNRKQDIFLPKTTALLGDIDTVTTTIVLEDASLFLEPVADFRTLIRINDELIEYTGIFGNTLTGVTRDVLDGVSASHSSGDEVTSFYILSGSTLPLSLKILLSGSGPTDAEAVFAVNDDGTGVIQNAIFFDDYDIREKLGASVGDLMDLTSITLPGNDFTGRTILDYGQLNNRSYYVVDGAPLTTELVPNASAVLTSQYDVLPDGCALKMHQVDIPQFERVAILFPSRFLDFEFYLKEEITASSFINEQIYLPTSFYHLPRKGKNSIGVFNPPLTDLDTVRVNEDVILERSAPKIVIKRSVGKHFYNFVSFKFNEDTIGDKLLSSLIVLSAESTERIPAKNRGLKIESGGLRRNEATITVLQENAEKMIERYRFGAEEVKVNILFSAGLKTEIGDAVVFGSEGLQVSDSTRGDRKFQPRIMQIINKSVNFKNGFTRLTLLDTNYSIFARYGVISPASKVISISGNKITAEPYCETIVDTEQETWEPLVNTRVQLRLPDFSYVEELTIIGASGAEILFLNAPTLPVFPVDNGLEGDLNVLYEETDLIIESIPYPQNDDPNDQIIWKDTYVYFNPRLVITNVIDASNFEVDNADLSAVIEGAYIVVHPPDFTDFSDEVKVTAINSNTITTDIPLSYLPSIGDEVDLVGFIDGGYPYRFF